jgi:hypothetical protein
MLRNLVLWRRSELKLTWTSRTNTWTGATQDPSGRRSRELRTTHGRKAPEEKLGPAQAEANETLPGIHDPSPD